MKRLKISELEKNITYILCPDKSCQQFFDDSRGIPCEYECPKKYDLKKIMRCGACDGMIVLPGDHTLFRSVRHDCPDGKIPLLFRPGNNYQLIYKMPK